MRPIIPTIRKINEANAANIAKIPNGITNINANAPKARYASAESSCNIASITMPVGLPDICLSSEPQRYVVDMKPLSLPVYKANVHAIFDILRSEGIMC